MDYFHLAQDAQALHKMSNLGLAYLGDAILTEAETTVFKRGRNANPHTYPKGATRQEYQIATGLEALFGWLYLQGETERLNTLFETMMEGEV